MKTVVYQSYRTTDVPAWIETCLTSVRQWAGAQGFEYRFFGDEFLQFVPSWYREKADGRIPIVTDLARLLTARGFLEEGFERTIWLDADVLVFDPDHFGISVTNEFAFGEEVWVQPSASGGLRAYRNVHNAICVFARDNAMLDFYIHACKSILRRLEGGAPPQIVGPKLLSALHNMIGFELIGEVGMLSPLSLRDVANGGGPALDMLREKQSAPLCALNLCSSLAGTETDGVHITTELLEQACEHLICDSILN
ncbi:MAG: hypothetical protein ISR44_10435 [Rhodospirillales bacterium]|nr:hypothetical protein [Rhodospirillales bacterium]